MKKLIMLVLALGVGLPACASMRGVEVGTDSANTYAVEVTNRRASTVHLSYVDAGRTIELGSVTSGSGPQRFIIASPSNTSISLMAKTASGSVVGTYNVVLTSGATARVTVQ